MGRGGQGTRPPSTCRQMDDAWRGHGVAGRGNGRGKRGAGTHIVEARDVLVRREELRGRAELELLAGRSLLGLRHRVRADPTTSASVGRGAGGSKATSTYGSNFKLNFRTAERVTTRTTATPSRVSTSLRVQRQTPSGRQLTRRDNHRTTLRITRGVYTSRTRQRTSKHGGPDRPLEAQRAAADLPRQEPRRGEHAAHVQL